MNRETLINGDKTILNTKFYLYLLSCENEKNKLSKYLEDMISIRESYLGTDNANFDIALEDEIDVIKGILKKVKSVKYE